MLISHLKEIIRKTLPQDIDFTLEVPPDKKFGDMACNAAMLLAKKLGKNPRELAEEIKNKLEENKLVKRVEIAGPGFLNLFLAAEIFQQILLKIEEKGKDFARVDIGHGEKTLLEFISANPTGPLTIANGRGGFGGDVVARVLERAGYDVSREFYVNDAGRQIELLGKSLQLAKGGSQFAKNEIKDFYQGEYIQDLAKKHAEKITADALETGRVFLQILLEEEIKPAVAKMGIKFDKWFSETSLRDGGELKKTLDFFEKKKLTYKKDGALFLQTSKFADDKDRVIVKSNGDLTYVLPDLMYHKNKFERGFTKLIDILGADHHGYVPRLKVGVQMLGFGEVEVIITQLVKLFRKGKEVRMSKRAGNFELMDDLIAEVGADAARWFFVMRDWNTHLNFDLDLAKKQSSDNPVFYVQYAHTRMASILEKAGNVNWSGSDVTLLEQGEEFDLIKKLSGLPNLVEEISDSYEVHRLTNFARELAEIFHRFYEKCRVIDEKNLELTRARLRLVEVAKEVLKIVLEDLVGVSAPEKM